jgi:hypothetical protein
MTARDLVGYQFGSEEAIRRVAGSRYLLLVGAVLVLITSVPRNYDQTYIGEVPWWPVIPLVFSFFSGSFLFWVLQAGFIREAEEKFWRKYLLFLGLFWMTAPTAWLYGIPVERFMDGRGATVANLWLLGIVSLWRVVLMTRVVSMVFSVPAIRAGGWVLLAASVEVVVVLFFRVMGEAVARGMGGMRNSAEQDLIIDVLSGVFMTCLIAAPVLLITMVSTWKLFKGKARLIELNAIGGIPSVALILAALAWIGIAIQPQKELKREFRYRSHLENSEFREALTYLNTLEPTDWPPAKSFRPDPYEYEVWSWLPGLMSEVTGKEKAWVQEKLLWVFERTFEHGLAHGRSRFDGKQFLQILQGIERFEGGDQWIRNSRELWEQVRDVEDLTELLIYLNSKGIQLKTEEEPSDFQ